MPIFYRIAAAILLVAATADAAAAQEIHAGLIVGPTLSDITYEDPNGLLDPRLGVNAGFFMVIGAGGRFSLQPEATIAQRGVIFPAEDELQNQFEATYNLTYIELPVLARVAHPVGFGRAFVLAGPAVAYRAGAKFSASGYQGQDASVYTRRFDVGASFGAGMEFDVDGGSIQVSLRFNQGFLDVESFPLVGPGKNRSANLMIGFARVYGRY